MVLSEIDCYNFLENMKSNYDELATKHSNELKCIKNQFFSISFRSILMETINCNAFKMLKYYDKYIPKYVPESRDIVLNTLYAAEYCLNNSTKRADK